MAPTSLQFNSPVFPLSFFSLPAVCALLCARSIQAQDRVDTLVRALRQLVLGTVTLLDARRKRLAYRYQRGITPRGTPRPEYHTAPARADQANMMHTDAGN
jgi:hypothetical protein